MSLRKTTGFKGDSGATLWTPADDAQAPLRWLDATTGVTTGTGDDADSWADQAGSNDGTGDATLTPQTGTQTQNGLNVIDFPSPDGAFFANDTQVTTLRSELWVMGDILGSDRFNGICPIHGEDVASGGDYTQTVCNQGDVIYDISIDGQASTSGNASHNGNDLVSGGNIDLGMTEVENEQWNVWYADYDSSVPYDWMGKQTWGGSNTDNMMARVGEIVQYDVVINATLRAKVEGYLAWKWGLEGLLPIGHTYEDAPPYI